MYFKNNKNNQANIYLIFCAGHVSEITVIMTSVLLQAMGMCGLCILFVFNVLSGVDIDDMIFL
jgi:hypothetical protein